MSCPGIPLGWNIEMCLLLSEYDNVSNEEYGLSQLIAHVTSFWKKCAQLSSRYHNDTVLYFYKTTSHLLRQHFTAMT